MVLFAGCRFHRDYAMESRYAASDIAEVQLRRLDGLLGTSSELRTMRIEYYYPPLTNISNDSAQTSYSTLQGSPGPVKSIEISTGRTSGAMVVSGVDSTSSVRHDETKNVNKKSDTEARQAGGTVIGIVIVLAVAFLCYLSLKSYIK